jgi:aminoglycoside phosphotransferase (APT) family kinase protein
MPREPEERRRRLAEFARFETGDSDAEVESVEALPGHAGQSYGFTLRWRSAGAPKIERLALRLAPEGVRIAGPADVVRQARIMESLAATAVPVPAVRWYGGDPRWFGRPYFVVAFVKGDKLTLGERRFGAEESAKFARQAVEAIAALHRLDWRSRQAAWGEPVTLAEELGRLDTLLNRPTLDPKTVARAPELRDRLRASIPTDPRIGCVHGDYQWSNCLFSRERLAAVIDWELALIGAVLIDLGWLCLFSDPESLVTGDLVPEHIRSPDEIAALYNGCAEAPAPARDVRWFRAFAGYRFGVITAFNLMLHRRGKRPDPTWEQIALSAPRLFERGLELLG